MVQKIDLSIIILNYNTQDLLERCLQSLEKTQKDGLNYETIVVDNASNDGSQKMVTQKFPKVRLIVNPKNFGFAKGNNVGIRIAKGRFILLLNSDTEVLPETLIKMVRFMDEKKEAGLATCRVELLDGKIDPACHRGFPTPWASLTYLLGLEKLFPKSRLFAGYHQTFKNLGQPHEVDSPSGTFFLIRREALEKVGLLDEDYFFYGEDLDFAYRLKQAGFQVWYCPEVKIIHLKKQSGRAKKGESDQIKRIRKNATNHFYETMKIFYKKHYFQKYPFLVNWLVLFGVELKRRRALLRC